MKDNICACGRKIPNRFNSTIKAKQCPKCTLLNLTSGDSKAVKSGLASKPKKRQKLKASPHDRFYKSKAWWYFSRYMLLFYSIDGVYANCCTCGTSKTLNNRTLHAGHWIKVFDGNSTNYATSFEFTNLAPQCYKCNHKMGGRERLMQSWLTEKHGEKEISRLQILSKQAFKLDDYVLDLIALEYETKFDTILNEKGWKNPWKK